MMKKDKGTFIVKYMNVRMPHGRQCPVGGRTAGTIFRSALELLKLIDGAISGIEENIAEGGSHEEK